ncbi:MAG: hypothetical protein OWT28_01245 [Firmicutes bacterium]|nr:hypothetical protein [Bacillota bacterium]
MSKPATYKSDDVTLNPSDGRVQSKRFRVFSASIGLLLYIAAVNTEADHWVTHFDQAAVVLPHDAIYFAILFAGVWLALSLSTTVRRIAEVFAQVLLPKRSDAQRAAFLRAASAAMIVLGMLPTLAWTLPSLNLFIDTHLALLIEVDVIVVVMGFLAGTAWSVLIPERAWLGLWVTPAVVLMTLANVLSHFSW